MRHKSNRDWALVLVPLCLFWTSVHAQTDVYVDFVYPGVESGTALQPYDTLGEALGGVGNGGTVHILSNDSHETPVINQPVTLNASGGAARLGVLSSLLGSGAPLEWLRITEIMYNPGDGGAEYLELQNTGPASLDVSGVFFSDGIVFTFPGSTVLQPGEYFVLVRDTDVSLFSSVYPGVPVDGIYTGALDNGGETLQLSSASAVAFLTLTYNDGNGWPGIADGVGFSLVINNPQGDPNDPSNWRGSAQDGGSPGDSENDPNNPVVVINEALTHTDLPQVDTVEIYNPTGQTADIRGWFISDDRLTPQRARIPDRSEFMIPAGGYAVIDETDFAPAPDGDPGTVNSTPLPGFRLSSFGEGIYLFSADASGVLTGYMHGFSFGAAENGVTFGREVTSDGREHFVAQTAATFGSANAGPAIGSLVISEIHYNPVPEGVEYLEVTNRSGSTVNLYDDTSGGDPSNTHKISGIDFFFPPGQSIPAGGSVLIVNAPPSHYIARFGDPGIPVYGPFGNHIDADAFGLSNADETLRVKWADHEATDPDTGLPVVPYVAMDEVRYDDDPPWQNADNNFMSIARNTLGAFGSEPTNWTAQSTSHQPSGGAVAAVTLSLPRGFYASSQSLSLSTTTLGASIWYTTDGSLPAPSFGTSSLYGGPISITTNTPIRAAAYKGGLLGSTPVAATYIINAPANETGAKALAVIADPQEDLFAPNGIMAIQGGTYVDSTFRTLKWVPKLPETSQTPVDNPFTEEVDIWYNALGDPVYPEGSTLDPSAYNHPIISGRFMERAASFEMLDPNDINAGQQVYAGIRVHGSTFHRPRYAMDPNGDWTQPQLTSIQDIIAASYLKFSLRMYFRGDYGPTKLTWDIFPGDTLLSYDKVVLRGGHNDGYNPFLKDELTRRLFIDMGQVSARGELYSFYLNGVYRGYYNATERHDEDFLSDRLNATKDWDILAHPLNVASEPFNPEVKEGDRVAWDALMAAAGQDLSIQANYDAVAAMLDIDAFIDYLLVQLYAGNDDWPNNNYAAARERMPGKKWIFLVWDAEATYIAGNINKTGLNYFPFWQWNPAGGAGLKGENVPIAVLYRALVANAGFRSAFQTRAQMHFGNGGALDAPNVTTRYNELKSTMTAVMPPGETFNDFIGTDWIPNREAVVVSALQAEGLHP